MRSWIKLLKIDSNQSSSILVALVEVPSTPVLGDLAFVGPKHIKELSDFQYVEVVAVNAPTVTVKLVGPDMEEEDAPDTLFSILMETLTHRIVSASEQGLWPGSFLAHPVAFARMSMEGIQEWCYGVVSGYETTGSSATLHIVSSSDSSRLTLSESTLVIKADVLNYALQTGAGVNTAAVKATELVEQQNTEVTESLTVPFNGDESVPLIRPSTLQLVRVRRQHIVDFKTAARTKRPTDLYTDHVPARSERGKRPRVTTSPTTTEALGIPGSHDTGSDEDSAASVLSSSSVDENVREVQHLHRPLSKRRRIEQQDFNSDTSSSSDNKDISRSRTRNRGVNFHPAPTDRRVHSAIVRQHHTGMEPQLLLQSIQQSQQVEFIATPPVLRAAYAFGFGVGLSIMHFRRARTFDAVLTTENGVNMWDFSSRNCLSAPSRAASLTDLIGAISCFYKFAKLFYNKATRKFIGAARDFVILYADTASDDAAMVRILTHWINAKFSRFRSRLVTKSLRSALRIRKEFSRNDEALAALKEALPSLKLAPPAGGSYRSGSGDVISRAPKTSDHRHSSKTKIPSSVIAALPKNDDGRQLCMQYISKVICTMTECARAHFKPTALTDEAKALITQRWKGLADEFKDL
ncbi:hypothetical protein GN244_ATG02621 [Phytophthora infestans]|uniref:Uncharacterized protein n=1 Tax=Phytophthora infestans TaxID=4787 RepID=A0A833WLU4_PHYIN|nr:hypothetical protein GN244_ATG02621 [Phytophthora infestans]